MEDRYTIELPSSYSIFIGAGKFKIGNWITVEKCGFITPTNGPYCSWPKAEPRYFKVSIK